MNTTSAQVRSKRPRTVLAGPYGHPFHPIAVTIPIGTWVASLVFEIIGLAAGVPTPYAIAARVLILIGLVGAVAAAGLGLLDFLQLAPGTVAHRTGIRHMALNLGVTALFLVILLAWWLTTPDIVPVWAFILTIVGLAALGLSGWLGGRLAYHYGVRVADEGTQAEGFAPVAARPSRPRAQEDPAPAAPAQAAPAAPAQAPAGAVPPGSASAASEPVEAPLRATLRARSGRG
jgi:uncharacterized membrane protein